MRKRDAPVGVALRGGRAQAFRKLRRLCVEKSQQLAFEIMIAKGLSGEMDKVDRRLRVGLGKRLRLSLAI